MRSPHPVAIGLLGLLVTASAPTASPAIHARAVPLDRADPARGRVGRLRYLGGWELTSGDAGFGGLSAMAWRDGGLVAVSDTGMLFRIGFVDGVPVGRVVGPLPAGPGDAAVKADRDAESLATDPASGRMWIGFEMRNAIWRYDAGFTRGETHAAPPAMAHWPANGGAEAMIRLRDGRFLILSEQAKGPERSTALLMFAGDPTLPGPPPLVAGYRAPPGYRVTDGTQLPDGRLLLLHRRASLMEGVSAIVSILDPAAIRAGRAVQGTAIARLAPPLTVDNMEVIATSTESGRTIVWIASDDNFSPIQRSLLLKFALEG